MVILYTCADDRLKQTNSELAGQKGKEICTFGGPVEFLFDDFKTIIQEIKKVIKIQPDIKQIELRVAFHSNCHFVKVYKEELNQHLIDNALKIPDSEREYLKILSIMFLQKFQQFINENKINSSLSFTLRIFLQTQKEGQWSSHPLHTATLSKVNSISSS